MKPFLSLFFVVFFAAAFFGDAIWGRGGIEAFREPVLASDVIWFLIFSIITVRGFHACDKMKPKYHPQ